MQNKIGYVILGVMIVIAITGIAKAEEIGLMLTLQPNITSIYNTYNVTGGKNTSSDDAFLSNDSLTIFFNDVLLNATIDARVTGGAELDPHWTANMSNYMNNATLYSIFFTDEDNITCTDISGLSAGLCDGTDADTTYSCSDWTGCTVNDSTHLNGELASYYLDDTTLSQEQVEDYCGAMVTGNTETNIAVTYEDGDGTLDFIVTDAWWNSYTDFMGTTTSGKLCRWDGSEIDCDYDDQVGSGGQAKNTSSTDPYLTNDTTTIYFQEGVLNATIDNRNTWFANYTACASGNHLYFSSGSLACEADDTGTDDQTCAEVSGCVAGAITEIDNWAADVNNYPAGCSAGNYVRAIGDTLTCEADTDTDTWNTTEEMQDAVWTSGIGTTTRITVTYQDGTNDVDFVVDDMNDDQPDNDGEVPDDITVDTTKWINTTQGLEICNGANCWKLWVNGSDYFIIEEV